MNRNKLNLATDVLTLILFQAMVVTGLVVRFLLPPGSGGRRGGPRLTLWGLGRHDWGDVHFWMSLTLVLLLVVHVGLHWSWVCETVRRAFNPRAEGRLSNPVRHLYGAMFLAAVAIAIGVFFLVARAGVVRSI